jgi:hypothetical protein
VRAWRIVIALLTLAAGDPTRASEVLFRKDSIFFFGGVHSTGNLGQSLNPFDRHDDSYLVGAAYARDLVPLGAHLVLGGEIGAAARFGNRGSAEFWGGPSMRLHPIPIGDTIAIAPALVVGLSAVTEPNDIERRREIQRNGNATLLFYLAPEIALLIKQWPNLEIVYRLHHRSGLLGTLGHLEEGSNAHVLGVRWRM